MKKRPASTNKHFVPSHQLSEAILDILRAEPRTTDEMAGMTGYSGNAIRERLAELRTLGCAYRELQPNPTGGGFRYMWFIGAQAELVQLPNRGRARLGGIEQPHQPTVRQYPAFHHRDPLVSALFGASQKEPA